MAKKNVEVVEIPQVKLKVFELKIVGDTPLIMNKWSEKAKQEMLDKQMKKATSVKEAKNPIANAINSIYWLEGKPIENTIEAFENAVKNGARVGFPSIGFKQCAASAGYRNKLTKDKVSVYGAFNILEELTEIHGDISFREDMVTIANGSADIRYRGQVDNWWAVLTIKYNESTYSQEQIINLINLGGFSVGVGEWRTEKGGIYGSFHVE